MQPRLFFTAKHGRIFLGDSLRLMESQIEPQSVDLIMTSPPFGLVRKKSYGNVESEAYENHRYNQ
jgi:site-specific DNA-methyltransferase (cytosine-N4-specific)